MFNVILEKKDSTSLFENSKSYDNKNDDNYDSKIQLWGVYATSKYQYFWTKLRGKNWNTHSKRVTLCYFHNSEAFFQKTVYGGFLPCSFIDTFSEEQGSHTRTKVVTELLK